MCRSVAQAVAVTVLMCIVAVSARADTLTLSYYDHAAALAFFHRSNITMQAARFLLPAPARLVRLRITLTGRRSGGTARLRVFGHEGGASAPVVEHDLIDPIIIRKSKPGIERIDVELPTAPVLHNNQFFVALDSLDPTIKLLSDQVAKSPNCTDGSEQFYYQFLQFADGTWRWERYSYAIDATVDLLQPEPSFPFSNVTAKMQVFDTIESNRSISWCDVDDDGYLDLLWDGRLYRNDHGDRFTDVTSESGIAGTPRANAFIDANNDGNVDVLFLGTADTTDRGSRLFLNDGDGRFTTVHLDVPEILSPVSYSIGDINGDEFVDVVVIQRCDSGACGDMILMNDAHDGFRDGSDRLALLASLQGRNRQTASQLLDIDRDGDLDLFVASGYPDSSIIVTNDGSGRFTWSAGARGTFESTYGPGSGCDWQDIDNDGRVDLLLTRSTNPYLRRLRGDAGTEVIPNHSQRTDAVAGQAPRPTIPYEYRQSGGAWGDINNDGAPDIFLGSNSPCAYSELYEASDTGFVSITYDAGLMWTSARDDGVWVDFDNDGKLDLVTTIGNHLALLKNERRDIGDALEVELKDDVEGHAAGAMVTVYANGKGITRIASSGRGVLVQDPFRLHFGVGDANMVDSVVVAWTDNRRTVMHQVPVNTTCSIDRRANRTASDTTIGPALRVSATPNPFREHLNLNYTIPYATAVHLALFTAEGDPLQVLVDEQQGPGEHSVAWTPTAEDGTPIPSGAYVYRLTIDGDVVSGVVILRR